jgi:hypothetical protein
VTCDASRRPSASVVGRSQPIRIYEPNITHSPFKWMGIWTPHGWRVHRKRFGKAIRKTIKLSGDGKTTFFPGALCDPATQRVEWQDDLHLQDDALTDSGIFPCDPRVEYPPRRNRWQVSHTLLAGLVADHNLYTHEYTWDMAHGHLYTHFRTHVVCENARTDKRDGRTVQVRRTPISTTIEGNVSYPLNNSAVRGVWADPDKQTPNLYTRRVVQLLSMHNGVYVISPYSPVVQCYGLFPVNQNDPIESLFGQDTNECMDRHRLQEELCIPLDFPKLGMVDMKQSLDLVPSRLYESDIWKLTETTREITPPDVEAVRERVGSRFVPGACGYAFEPTQDQSHEGYRGYNASFDINGDGLVDDTDVEIVAKNVGRRVRYNLYQCAYFGGDWLSTSVATNPELDSGDMLVADYEYGGGYDGQAGVIQLQETPGPDQPVWVEYHYDAPAEPGEDNIVVHIYDESGEA